MSLVERNLMPLDGWPTDHRWSATAPLQVTAVDSTADFAALRDEWEELLQASDADGLFLTWEWLFTWWQEVGSRHRLAIALVRQGGRLIGLAPWVVRRRLPARLEFLGSGRVGSDYLDVVARRGSEDEVVQALAAHLDRRGGTAMLTQMPERGLASHLARALVSGAWRSLGDATHVCPFIDLSGHDWESLLASLGPSHRSNLRRRLRQLEARYSVDFSAIGDAAELDRSFDVLLELHQLRWQRRGGSDALVDAPLVSFHRRFSRLALERGWLRLFVLRLDGRPAAVWYGFRYGDRFLFYQAGFDPAFACRSVGMVSMCLAIRAALQEGAKELDLLHGAEPYKLLWTRRARTLERLELFPPSAWGALSRQLTQSIRGVKRWLRALPGTVYGERSR